MWVFRGGGPLDADRGQGVTLGISDGGGRLWPPPETVKPRGARVLSPGGLLTPCQQMPVLTSTYNYKSGRLSRTLPTLSPLILAGAV